MQDQKKHAAACFDQERACALQHYWPKGSRFVPGVGLTWNSKVAASGSCQRKRWRAYNLVRSRGYELYPQPHIVDFVNARVLSEIMKGFRPRSLQGLLHLRSAPASSAIPFSGKLYLAK